MTHRVRTWSLLSLLAVSVLPIAVACGGKDKPAETAGTATAANCPPGAPPGYPGCPAGAQPTWGGQPTGQPTWGGQPTGQPTWGGAPTGPTGQPTMNPTAPASTANNPFGPLASAAASLLNPASVDVTEAGIAAQALRLAPNMQPEGNLIKNSLTEGQHASSMISLQGGKCYTILGFAAPGTVGDLKLELYGPPLYTISSGKSGGVSNAPAILNTCPVTPLAVPYKLDIFAAKGAGMTAVRIYSKMK